MHQLYIIQYCFLLVEYKLLNYIINVRISITG